jgi:hypothetical protein
MEFIKAKNTQLETAIEIIKKCDKLKPSHYKHVNIETPFACGYWAPGIAIAMFFLEVYQIQEMSDFRIFDSNPIFVRHNDQDVCGQLTKDLFYKSINEAIGYLWNQHMSVNAGIDFMIHNSEFTPVIKTELFPGINIVSFISNEHRNMTVHHSFLYIIGDTCFIVDSWGEMSKDKTVIACRAITKRVFSSSEIANFLRFVNQENKSTYDYDKLLTEGMLNYFYAPTGSYYNNLTAITIDPTFIKDIAAKGLFHICSGNPGSWGGKKRINNPKNKRKEKKRQTKNKRMKNRKTKHNKKKKTIGSI